MRILSRQELSTGKVFVNLVLTEEEVKKLIAGNVITGEVPYLAIQIVGYGEEEIEEVAGSSPAAPTKRRSIVEMRPDLIKKVDREIERGLAKWGEYDQIPDNLISAAVEELGEVAHAINHNEGIEKTQQEIAEVIGVLVRLYDMVEVKVNRPQQK